MGLLHQEKEKLVRIWRLTRLGYKAAPAKYGQISSLEGDKQPPAQNQDVGRETLPTSVKEKGSPR